LFLNYFSTLDNKIRKILEINGELTKSLNKAQINKIYKKLAKKTHINHQILKRISGHSTRIGATQDLMSSGASLRQ
jgi:hypothetical protein